MRKFLFPLLALAALVLPARAAIDLNAIKPDGFAHGVTFTVAGHTNANGTARSALTNFPVLVRLSETDISGFDYDDVLLSGGGDIRFADANGNALPFEIDTWTNDAMSLVWVTLSEMTNGTEFAMFYGAAQSDANAFVAARHPWADYTGVWHMGDTGKGLNKPINDSTTNALHGTTGCSPSQLMDDGAVGGARKICNSLNTKNKEQISVSLSDADQKAVVDALVPQFSVSLWYRIKEDVDSSIHWDYLIGRKPSEKSNTSAGWAIQMSDAQSDSGTGVRNGIRVWSCETSDGAPPASAIPVIGQTKWTTVAWFKLDVVYSNNTYKLYLDGEQVGGGALKGNVVNGNSTILGIGGGASSGGIRPFTGDMDEVRLRRGIVSADWVAADYATQKSPSFLSAGTVEMVGASTKPIAEFSILDKGAAFVQFSGKVTSLGEGATACTLHYKYWKDSESEPAGWTPFATGVGAGETVNHFLVGLDPLTDYHIAFKASNDLATPEDSDIQTEPFTTSGVGDAGESGGASERQLDEFVHTFTVTERGVSEFEFTPPTGVTKVEALVVAGGGAGGYYHGGGGGGGGLVYDDALAVVPGQTYTIRVGAGGAASESADVSGGNGGDSSIAYGGVALVSATGGGAGGNGGSNMAGQAGGSGGGSSANVAAGNGTTGQGFAGAKGNGSQAGGGGGAKEVGSEPVTGGTGAVSSGGGGSGLPFEISGVSILYAGGGGGGGVKSLSNKTYGTAGAGGLGGGGKGGQEEADASTATAENGEDGLGGGGGGGSSLAGYEKGGDGGSGVVIIRYGAGGDGDGVVHPTVSLTGLAYDDASGDATVTYRVGWAGDGYDRADVEAVWGFHEDALVNTNAVAVSAIGQGTGSFALPRVSKTVYVRLLATNSGNYTGVSPEVKSLVLFNPAAPGGIVSSATPSYTSATFVAAVTNLGAGATSVSGAFQICTDSFFDEGTYETFAADAPISATGTLTGAATGLSPDVVYWVRALLANDVPADYDTAPVSFRTLAMGAPVGTAGAPAASDRTISADVTVSSFGTGATSATMRLEASNANDFATVVATADAAAATGVAQTLTVSGLLPETTYYLRAVLVNDGGVQTVLALGSATTTPAASPTVTLTIPSPLPANVTLVSVTTNGVAATGNAGVYTVLSNATVVATFAAEPRYRLVGDATVTVVMDANKTLENVPTAELIASPTAILTIPSPLPANVSLVSVTTNGVAVAGVESAYTVLSNDTVTVTFAAAAGYRLVGDATVAVVMDADKTLTGIPTAEPIPIPTVTLTIPELPANVTLVSVTTNDVAVVGVAGVYTVQSNATVVATFAAAAGYVLTPAATVSVVVDGNRTLAGIPTAVSVAAPTVSQSATKVYARKTVTLTASATGATSYLWLKNGVQIDEGASGTLTVNWRKPKGNPIDTYRAVAVYDIDSLPAESGASQEMTVENLPMGTVISVQGRNPAPPAPHDYSADYLTFRVLTAGTICWKAFGGLTKTIEYSINDGEWISIASTSDGATISVSQGDLVRFRGSNTAYATSKSAYSGFEGGTATYDIEGNIMSLLYGDNFADNTTLPNSSYTFCSLFKKAPVVSAENLVLPATALTAYCYRALFSWCTTLTKAPELPATTLATGCYWYMFEHCAITEAPVLNATTLVAECYGHMFTDCGLLNRITCLATSGFGTSKCLEGWVTNVAGEGAFVKAADVTSWATGVNGIPTGWIVCEDVLLLPPEVSFFGDTIELECDTAGAEIHYRLGQTGDFALYTAPISIVADTVVEAYSAYQGKTSQTVTQTCVYVHETPFEQSNKNLTTWKYGGNTITTPYSVNAIDGHSSSYSKGTFAFDTSITLREAQPTYLWFQHADQSADVYVDNVKVGTHWGGYNAFFVDISEYVHRGKNDIRVALCNTTRNTLAPAAGDFNFNATLGNVKLFTSPVLPAMEYGYDGFHITSTVSDSSATINVETKVPIGASLVCTISDVDSDGSYTWTSTPQPSTGSKQTFTTTISGSDLRLWNGTLDPHLYTVTLEIRKDGELYHKYERPYGFRYYEYVVNQTVNGENYTGFLLNGRPYLLRGVCMHDDVEGKANALDDSDYDQEFAIIRELGCNFIRLAHYPHPKEVYDRCDRLGIIVQTEVPCVNKLQSTLPDDYYTHLATQYTDMVEQHFNHPCIVFWGLSNETTTDDASFGKVKIEGYYNLIKGLDSERLVGYVMSHNFNNPAAYYNDPDVDWFGCNIYVGWYIDKTKNDPSSQLNTRIKNTITDRHKPLAFSEYGCGGTPHCHSTNFMATTTTGNNPRHDIEYQMWLHEGHIAAIRNYPQLLFTGQWQLFDIAVSSRKEGYTECLDGENATTNEDLKYLNNKGLVERDHRTKKDTFYLYKAEWNSKDKFVHICGKDYTKTTDRKLKCYTNDGNTLSLYVGNDPTPLETVTVNNHIAEFTARDYTPGVEIRVVGATASDTVTFQ